MPRKPIVILFVFLILLIVFTSAWPFIILAITFVSFPRLMRSSGTYQNIGLLFLAALIAISIGEIFLRIKGDNQNYSELNESPMYHIIFTTYESPFTPNEQGWLHIQPINWIMKHQDRTVNSEGLYDIERSLTKTKKCRVVALGDSFTEGVGSTNDSNFVHLLEKGNDTLEIIKGGMNGSDPAFELKLLELRMFKYHPDVVIMSINSSDVNDFMIRGGMERFMPDSTVRFRQTPWWEVYYGYSFIVRSLVHNLCKLNWIFMSPDEETKAKAKAIKQLGEVIEIAGDECRARHIRFVANFHPVLQEVYENKMECTPVMKEVQKHNIETFDMLHYFTGHGIDSAHASQYYWEYDRHNNNRGYAIIAKGLSTLF